MKTDAVWVRWGIRRDLPQVLAIEQETFGRVKGAKFDRWMDRHDTVLMVAESEAVFGGPDSPLLGFAFYRLKDGDGTMIVLDMAALAPAARAVLVAKLYRKAAEHRRVLGWREC